MKKQVDYSTAGINYRQETASERKAKRKSYDRMVYLIIAALTLLVIALSVQVLSAQADALTEAEKPETAFKELQVEQKQTSEVMAVTTETVEKETVSEVVEVEEVVVQAVAEAPSIYNPEIPMPKEHQEYLYKLCQEYGLEYKKTLAVIQHESVFDPNATNATNDFGYFQINQVNHATLSEKLQTENNPFNPYVNMQWGTHMLSDLYTYWSSKGYHGQGLDDAVWSSYNRGKTGFLENGHAVAYINKMKASIETINSKF